MEEEVFRLEGEFVFSNYMPTELQVGMTFLTQIVSGVLTPQFTFFTLTEIPEDMDAFIKTNGAPVIMNIITKEGTEAIIALQEEIGYFDNGEELLPITEEQINIILNDHSGLMDVECDETGDVILYEGKVIISYLSIEETEED
jgi:hypothetical protein